MYKALFIDDREMDNLLNSLMVREELLPLDAIFIANAIEALEYLKDQADEDFPAFIFVDYHMPMMNGIEFVEAYNEILAHEVKAQNTTLCFLSSYVNEQERVALLAMPNVKAFYNKPINKSVFADLLSKHSNFEMH